MRKTEGTYDRRLFLAYVAFSLTAVFYLHFLVPTSPSASSSYIFGYNNRVGVALLLLLVAIGAVWTQGLNFKFSRRGISQPVSLRVLAACLVAVLCACLAMYSFAGRFGGFGESSYAIDRAWLLSQGKIPYLDFEYAYGVFFLYGPVLLQHLLPISIAQAYYLFWILNFLLGTWILFTVVNMIDYPTHSKLSIFILLYIPAAFSILNMGVNYTPLRYLCPLFFILVVQRYFKGNGTGSQIYAVILTAAFTLILLLVSPETAIAFAFACVSILLFSGSSLRHRSLAILVALAPVWAAIFWAAMKLHVLDTIKADSGGADSFPVVLAPHILLFFAALFICACYIWQFFAERQINDNTIGLIAFSIPMIAAALGRCDAGHVYWNGQGVFLASMFYVSNQRSTWKLYRAAFVAFMVLIPTVSGLLLYSSSIGRIMRSRSANVSGDSSPEEIALDRLYPSWPGMFLVPFGYKPNGIGTYLTDRIDYGHFEPFVNESTVGAIHEEIAEMKAHPEQALLLPDDFQRYCRINQVSQKVLISVLFATPFFREPVHPESVRKPVCDYIFANYRLIKAPNPQNFEYGLWIGDQRAGR